MQRRGGEIMLVRVIYRDQTAGVVENHLLAGLIRKGRIAAYHNEDRWVSVAKETFSDERALSATRGLFAEQDRCTTN
jgi:hypothetical protein